VGLEEARSEGSELDNKKALEISQKAVATATVKAKAPEVVSNYLFEATMYPLATLQVAKGDTVMYDKLRSKLVKEGTGEYARHLASLMEFDEWLAALYVWLIEEQQQEAVGTLQKWRLSIVLQWAVGGKQYVKMYFKKYHGTFPVECDTQLMFRAQAVGMEKYYEKLEKYNAKTAALMEKYAATASDSD
jgi:hypothetical protein